jgi:hypothetical protein
MEQLAATVIRGLQVEQERRRSLQLAEDLKRVKQQSLAAVSEYHCIWSFI